jgi:hypothetical protein
MKTYSSHQGSDWKYKKGCRCTPCSKAHAAYEAKMKRIRNDERAGLLVRKKRLVDVAEARRHVRFLHANNVGARSINATTGISFTTIYEIGWGSRKYCTKQVADKILAVGIKKIHKHQMFDTEPVKQMLNKIKAKGYTKKEVGTMLGYKNGAFNIHKTMAAKNYKKFVELHCKLCKEDATT